MASLRALIPENKEAGIACANELLGVTVTCADVGQQAREQRHVDVIGAPFGALLSVPSELLGDVPQLPHQVEPLADAHIVQEIGLHPFAESIAAHLLARFLDKVPQVEHCHKV